MPSPAKCCHLHVHSEGSVLDGACRLDRLPKRAKELGMEAVGLTDHGTMSQVLKFQKACDKEGVKSILGCEVYFTEDRFVKDPANRYYHLTLLAENDQGYRNLCKLTTHAQREGWYYKPRADYELLKKYSEGLIVLSGCMAARTMQQLMDEEGQLGDKRFGEAAEEIKRMVECVGENNVYVELQNNEVHTKAGNQRQWNGELAKIAKDLKLPTVGTGDVHYLFPEDADPHDAMLCVQTKSLISTPYDQRMSLLPQRYYMRSSEEMAVLLDNVPESLPTTLEIAARCNARIRTTDDDRNLMFELLPRYPVPEDWSPAEPAPDNIEPDLYRRQAYLREQVYAGLHKRYGAPLPGEVIERAEFELETVNNMGVTDYFLIQWDVIDEGHRRGVPIGPGRGCFVPETPIWTPQGYVPISQMEPGAQVMTHTGEVAEVRKRFEYQVDEPMVRIRHYYDDQPGLTLTQDHRVLVEKGRVDPVWERQIKSRPSRNRWLDPQGELEWLPAREVEPGDLVAVPLPKLGEVEPPRWDLAQLMDSDLHSQCEVQEDRIIRRVPVNRPYPASARDLHRRHGLCRGSLRRALEGKVGPRFADKLQRVLDQEGFVDIGSWRSHVNRESVVVSSIPRYIQADESFCRLLGLLLADGWLRSDRAVTGLVEQRSGAHRNPSIPQLWAKVWGQDALGCYPSTDKDLTAYESSHPLIAAFYRTLLPEYQSTPHSKYLPEWCLRLPQPLRRALLEGLWAGDGSRAERTSYSTVSYRLAHGVRTLLWSLGMPNGLSYEDRSDPRPGFEGRGRAYRIVSARDWDQPPPKQFAARVGDYMMMRVRGTETVAYEGPVYDLSIDTAHDPSFVTSSCAVHNSGAGSILLYALNVTQLCPIQHGLLFERFLNPDRVSMPDVDVDWDPMRRAEMMDYMREKYGEEYTAQIITFGRIGSKAGIKRAAQAMGSEYYQLADRMSKMLPMEGTAAVPLEDALRPPDKLDELPPDKQGKARGRMSIELQKLVGADADAKRIIELAKWMEGMIQNESVHAAAFVVCPVPIDEVVPVQVSDAGKGIRVTAFDMKDAEGVGLLKLDFLGLRNLSVIKECERLIEISTGEPIKAWEVPLDDGPTYEMLAKGDSVGVFQFESTGMQDSLRTVGADRFEDLVAIVALYRPGPMANIPVYARRKRGIEPVTYGDERLREILEETQGIIVYQEQSMMVARKLAGFTRGDADVLRKAIGKKNLELMNKMRPQFVEGCKENKVPVKVAEDLWAENEKAAEYSFNKSHAAAYALISYVTAWLKANYPVEYMASLLTSVMSTQDKVPFYLYETKRMGITVLPPDINKSFASFRPEGEQGIRFGLVGLKGVGEGQVDEMVREREANGPFKGLWDFCQRVEGANKKVLESLILAGAFDYTGDPRKGLMEVIEPALKQAKNIRKKKAEGQDSLFDMLGGSAEEEFAALDLMDQPQVPKLRFSEMEKFSKEREVAGLYVSGHPLDHAMSAWESVRQVGLGQLKEEHITDFKEEKNKEGRKVRTPIRPWTVAGIITGRQTLYTKRDNSKFLKLILEDLTGSREIMVWSRTLEQNPDLERILQPESLIWARIVVEEDTRGFGAGNNDDAGEGEEPQEKALSVSLLLARPFDPSAVQVKDHFDIKIDKNRLNADLLNRLRETLAKFPGTRQVRLQVVEGGEVVKNALLPDSKVAPSPELSQALRNLIV